MKLLIVAAPQAVHFWRDSGAIIWKTSEESNLCKLSLVTWRVLKESFWLGRADSWGVLVTDTLYSLDVATATWKEEEPRHSAQKGSVPPGRSYLCSAEIGEKLYIHGGIDVDGVALGTDI